MRLAVLPRRTVSAITVIWLLCWLFIQTPVLAQTTPDPKTVTIPGTIQSVLGCPGDWQPSCSVTYLAYDPATDVWSARFELPAGSYEYKVALNDSWAENYGLNARRDGPNIPLQVPAPTTVRFIYDHKTHWVTDSINTPIIVAVGDFQTALGCPVANDPTCLGAWLQDPDGDGLFTFTTNRIPAGEYQLRLAIGETLTGAIGEGGPDGAPFTITVAEGGEVYIGYNVGSGEVTISTAGAPKGDISRARAYWVNADTIVWNVIGTPRYRYALFSDPTGAIKLTPEGVVGGQRIDLTFSPAGPGSALKQFPHLAGFSAFKLPPLDRARLIGLTRGQLVVAMYDENGQPLDATRVQIPGALDALFPYDGPLGVTFEDGLPTIRVWAPTARQVRLHRFADANPETRAVVLPMTLDAATGVWSIRGEASWIGQYYLFEVDVYVPNVGRVVTNLVTDPYSVALSANSTRSQIIDLNDPALQPPGWDTLRKPPLAAPEDVVLYELHVRDFSILDETVPPELRGTFRAFTVRDSIGMRHLADLAEAGVTHVHLLPVFDIATIEEIRERQVPLPYDQLRALPPDSPEQQAIIEPIRDLDGFNWGYDPFHYSVPEGSYSTNPDGPQRTLEFREMVQALNETGLRVVMDVVYNHTNASGQHPRSVLDRIVPGYYHRLDADGNVTTSTCCPNTATEHRMMEKLMIDSVVLWAKYYKVDGFRFDLMGHHMKDNMLAVRAALDALTLEHDGVDGKSIILYGEGWNFGEVANNARGINATQFNMAGTGIGTFSDRLRDAARGGGPFDDPRLQGFISGLATDPSDFPQGTPDVQRIKLLAETDLIKLGLAGNLKTYRMINYEGRLVTGEQIKYRGAAGGYTLDPQEQIVYVSAHDNETLFDAVQLKAAATTSITERVRMAQLGLSLTALAQGIPFFHAGDEFLRSKSLDRNSYNSSDWFNRIDWSGQENTFGSGLPPAGDNQSNWPIMAPLLANPELKPDARLMQATYEHFREMLRIRRSTPLFRLRTAAEVERMVSFFNNGPDQIPGLIVMSISDNGPNRLDPNIGQVVVLFNARPETVTITIPELANGDLRLHDVQIASSDERVALSRYNADGSFSVPGRTTAVFVGPRPLVAAPLVPPTATPTVAPEAPAVTPEPQPTPSGNTAPGWLWIVLLVIALVGAGLFVARRNRSRSQ
ncbi:pullulanase-type alpha-1,6-glucosidase [Chloroflexus sp. MS-G]|uniref:pullulanase-type alpha-1,6-glucosidase n=1 Tax=Chloroflexus sp. MS-G TaxID=1521187 RepID=UPI0004DF1644|nr:pullulanase-type alpha-1,6-glucosidase [Chloroflexus sp. MS-G]